MWVIFGRRVNRRTGMTHKPVVHFRNFRWRSVRVYDATSGNSANVRFPVYRASWRDRIWRSCPWRMLTTHRYVIAFLQFQRRGNVTVHFHVFPQRTWMGITFVTAPHPAVVRFVAGMDVRMFLPIRAVRESSVASFEFAFERFLTWNV